MKITTKPIIVPTILISGKEKPKKEFKFLWWKFNDSGKIEFKFKWNF